MQSKKMLLAAALSVSLAGSMGLSREKAPGPVPQNGQEMLASTALVFNDITQKAMPAVVSITTVKVAPPEEAAHGGMRLPLPDTLAPPPGEGEAARAVGVGSGAIIQPDGLIVTNYHVVENAERISVTLDDKNKVNARVVGADPKTDVALLRLEKSRLVPAKLPVLNFGDSDQLRVGDWALAIGSPFGLSRSVSFGIISSKSRGQMGVLDIEDFIQTDAAINPGSSGGPLLNSRGEIIGINTAIFSQGGGFNGIGFAIPSKIAREVVQQLLDHGRVLRGWIGVMAQDLDEDLARYFHAPRPDHGVLISEVVPKGPAQSADLRAGDVVLKIDDTAVDSTAKLKALVGRTNAGRSTQLEILRDGKPRTLTVKVAEEPGAAARATQLAGQAAPDGKAPPAKGGTPRPATLGLTVEDIPEELSPFLGVKAESGALIVGVKLGSLAFDAGLSAGDVILEANREKIRSAKDFAQATRRFKKGEVNVLYVQRGMEEKVFIPLKLTA